MTNKLETSVVTFMLGPLPVWKMKHFKETLKVCSSLKSLLTNKCSGTACRSFVATLSSAWLWGWQCQSADPLIWSRLKCFCNCWMECQENCQNAPLVISWLHTQYHPLNNSTCPILAKSVTFPSASLCKRANISKLACWSKTLENPDETAQNCQQYSNIINVTSLCSKENYSISFISFFSYLCSINTSNDALL